MKTTRLIVVLLLLLAVVHLTHQLNTNTELINFRYHCSSVSAQGIPSSPSAAATTTQVIYSMVYYMNDVIDEGQLIVREISKNETLATITVGLDHINVTLQLHVTSVTNESSGILVQYVDTRNTSVTNEQLVVNSSEVIHTEYFDMRVKSQYRKDAYYQRKLQFYTLDFSNVFKNARFQFIQLNSTSSNSSGSTTYFVYPDTKVCQDFTVTQTTNYYFQIAFSISTIIVAGIHVLHGLWLVLAQIVLGKFSLVRSRLLSEVPSGLAVNASDVVVLIMFSVDVFWIFKYGIRSSSLLIISAYVRSWLIYVACVSYVLNCLRYLLLLNFYRLVKHGNTVSKYHKILTSQWMFIVGLVVFASIMLVVCVITLSVIGIKALAVQTYLVTILAIVSCVAAVASGLISIVFELVVNYKSIKKYGLISYFRRDPLYIRIQMLGIVFLIAVGIAYGALFSFLEPNYRSISLTYGRVFGYVVVYFLFGLILRIIMAGAFIWPLQLIQLSHGDKVQFEFKFEELMSDPECYDLMYEYCSREFSLENLVFWKYAQDLKGKPIDYQTMVKMADKYMKPLSPLQINLPNKTVKSFLQLITDMEANQKTEIEFDSMYNVIRSDLLMNLDDTLKRFSSTSAFKEWEHKHETSKELIETQF